MGGGRLEPHVRDEFAQTCTLTQTTSSFIAGQMFVSSIAYTDHTPVDSWQTLKLVEDEFDERSRKDEQWAFRGQSDTTFPSTNLERHRQEFGLRRSKMADLEVKLVREFARSYRNYRVSPVPRRGDTRE